MAGETIAMLEREYGYHPFGAPRPESE
jgi:hypothetical protein